MAFQITGIIGKDDRFSRTWTGLVRLTDHTGEAPIEVIFHAPGDRITITALGGIAFADIPFAVQDYADLLSGRARVEFPQWETVKEIVSQCLYDLARRSTYRAVAEKQGWPLPANRDPQVRATITLGAGQTVVQDGLLSALAETIQDTSVVSITLTRIPVAPSGETVRLPIEGHPEIGLRVGYSEAYVAHHIPKGTSDHPLLHRRGYIRRMAYHNGDLKPVPPSHPAAIAVAEVTWDDSPTGTSGVRLSHLAEIREDAAPP